MIRDRLTSTLTAFGLILATSVVFGTTGGAPVTALGPQGCPDSAVASTRYPVSAFGQQGFPDPTLPNTFMNWIGGLPDQQQYYVVNKDVTKVYIGYVIETPGEPNEFVPESTYGTNVITDRDATGVVLCLGERPREEATLSMRSVEHPDGNGDGVSDTEITAPGPVRVILTATNTGQVELTDAEISRPAGATEYFCTPTTPARLATFDELTCLATFDITQEQIDRGDPLVVDGRFAAFGFALVHVVSATETLTTRISSSTGLTLEKTSTSHPDGNNDGVADAPLTSPDTVVYQFTFTNTGTTDLTNFTLNDPFLDRVSCSFPATLAPMATFQCTGETDISQADIDADTDFINTATATATGGGRDVKDTGSFGIAVEHNADLAITKVSTNFPDSDGDHIADTTAASGETIEYRIDVENTGNLTLDTVTVNDPRLTNLSCSPSTPASLAPGATMTCDGLHLVTSDDVMTGHPYVNHATATGTAPNGATTTKSANYVVELLDRSSLEVRKSSPTHPDTDGDGIADTSINLAGPTDTVDVDFEVEIENTGTTTLTIDGLRDSFPLSCPSGSVPFALAPGATETCTTSVTVDRTRFESSTALQNAVAVRAFAGSEQVGGAVLFTVPFAHNADITLEKGAAAPYVDDGVATGSTADDGTADVAITAPTTVNYEFEVTNTGNLTLSAVSVSDPLPGLSAIDCGGVATLLPGATMGCTATLPVDQAAVDAGGEIFNAATVEATDPFSHPVSDIDTYHIPIAAKPDVEITKTSTTFPDANNDQIADAAMTGPGDVDYEFLVENTGNILLTGVTVTDSLGIAVDCGGTTTLAVGASVTCTGTLTVDQTRFDGGTIVNTGTVMTDQAAHDSNSYHIRTAQTPRIDLTKTTTTISVDQVGDIIDYELVATNVGNVTLANVTITDDPILTGLTCNPALGTTLHPNESLTCTGDYEVTQADIDAAPYVRNKADASGTTPSGTVTDVVAITVPVDRNPSITLDKTPTPTSINSPGPIDYTLTAENDGNMTLTNVTITDLRLPGLVCTWPGTTGELAPTETVTCDGTHSVDQAEIDSGQDIVNAAFVTTAEGPTDTATATVTNNASSKLSVTKTADSVAPITAPRTVTYTIVITNEGTETLSAVEATDSLVPTLVCGPTAPATLAPTESMTCVGVYGVEQADIDAGGTLFNQVTATGTTATSPSIKAIAHVAIPIAAAPSIAVTKDSTNHPDGDADGVANTPLTAAGDIDYTIAVENTGNTTLSNVEVTDSLLSPGDIDCGGGSNTIATIAVGDTVVCNATYTVTNGEYAAAATISNTATATAPGPNISATDTFDVPVEHAQFTFTKKALAPYGDGDGDRRADLGIGVPGTITYELTATNTGNVTLTSIEITDPSLDSLVCPPSVAVAPGASVVCTGTSSVDQASIDAGLPIVNLATAQVVDRGLVERAAYIIPILQIPGIQLTKTSTSHPDTNGDGTADSPIIGLGPIEYEFTVRNAGNTTLTDVVVVDPLIPGLSCTVASIDPFDTFTCSGTYQLTDQGVIDAGLDVINTATVTAETGGHTLTDHASYDIPIERRASISVTKDAAAPYGDSNGDGVADAAISSMGNVTYQLDVTNTGNVTVTGLAAEDVIVGESTTNVTMACDDSSLDPGVTTRCAAVHLVTTADIDNILPIEDTATATATAAGGGTVTASALYMVPVHAVPELIMRKSIPLNPDLNGDFIGDTPMTGPGTIEYEISVANSGTVDLTNVTIDDPTLTTLDCGAVTPPFALAPGDAVTCTGEIVVSQTDFDTGYVPPFGGAPIPGIVNIATARGDGPGSPAVPVAAAWVAGVEFDWEPLITLEKTSTSHPDTDGDGVADTSITGPGTVTYELVASNDGNVTLDDVKIVDPGISSHTCVPAAPASLAPGEKMTCTGTINVDQADIDAGGDLVNVATVESKFAGHKVLDRDVYDIPIGTSPGLTLTKTSTTHPDTDGDNEADTPITGPGDVTYELVATNDGNVTLTDVTVTDPDVTGLTCAPTAPATLLPGASMTCTGTQNLAQADIDAASDVVNVATATATQPTGGTVTDSAAYDTPIDRSPDLTITKTPADQSFTIGETPTVSWTITVRNTGNVTLTDVTTDDVIIFASTAPAAPLPACERTFASLAPGASETYTCSTTRTITSAMFVNHITADATSPVGPISVENAAEVRSVPAPTTTTTTTTAPATTTTTTIAGGAVPGSTVPATGGDVSTGITLGVLFVLGGVAAIGVSRRRSPLDPRPI